MPWGTLLYLLVVGALQASQASTTAPPTTSPPLSTVAASESHTSAVPAFTTPSQNPLTATVPPNVPSATTHPTQHSSTASSSSEGTITEVSTPFAATTDGPVSTVGQQCQSLVQYAAVNPQCHSSQCAGVECSEACGNQECAVTLGVQKCTDPVQVGITIDNPQYRTTGYEHTFFENGGTPQTDGGVMVILNRNATFMQFQVGLNFDVLVPILPLGELPLNASDCMCQSLFQVANAITLPSIPLVQFTRSCGRLESCTGVHCNITANGASYSLDALVDPCEESLRLTLTDSSGSILFGHLFTDTESVPLDLGVDGITSSIDVTITHKSYSMMLKVSFTVTVTGTAQVFPILPEQQVILDRSNCSQPSYPTVAPTSQAPTSETPTSAVATSPGTGPVTGAPGSTVGQQCQSLVQYAAEHPHCHSSQCAGVECSEACGNQECAVTLGVQKCTDPVQVEITIDNPQYHITGYEHTFFENGGTTQADGSVMVTLNRNATFMQFQVAALSTDILTPILPFGELPLNASDCMCQSLFQVASAITLPSIPLVQFTRSCGRLESCRGVHCNITANAASYSLDALVDPCQESVRLILTDSSGSILFGHLFTDTGSVPLDLRVDGITSSIDVTITHKRYSMMLKVSLTVTVTGTAQVLPILPERQIILDRSNCSQPSYPTERPVTRPTHGTTPTSMTTPTVNTTSSPSPSVQSGHHLAAKVAVPVVVLVLCVLVAVLLAAVLFKPLYRRCKDTRQYSFQRMSFKEVSDVVDG